MNTGSSVVVLKHCTLDRNAIFPQKTKTDVRELGMSINKSHRTDIARSQAELGRASHAMWP